MNSDLSLRAKLYIGVVVGLGLWAMFRGAVGWYSADVPRLLCNLAVCILVSVFSSPAWYQRHDVDQFSLHPHWGEPDEPGRDDHTRVRRNAGAVHLEGKEPGPTGTPSFQRLQHGCRGGGVLRILRPLPTRTTPSIFLAASLVFFFMNTAPVAG